MGGAAIGLVISGLLIDQVRLRGNGGRHGQHRDDLPLHRHGWRLEIGEARPIRRELTLRESLRVTFLNRIVSPFSCRSFTLFQIGLTMLIAVLPYYAKVVSVPKTEGAWVSILTAVAIGMMVIFIPVFARLAHRTAKRHAFSMAMLGAAMTFPLLFFARFLPGIPKTAQVLIAVALAGAPVAGVYLFPGALTADIADDDETRTGMRREATYLRRAELRRKNGVLALAAAAVAAPAARPQLQRQSRHPPRRPGRRPLRLRRLPHVPLISVARPGRESRAGPIPGAGSARLSTTKSCWNSTNTH